MKTPPIYAVLFLVLLFVSCQQPKTQPPVATILSTRDSNPGIKQDTAIAATPDTTTHIENKVMDAVYALPEVKAFASEVRKGSNRFLIWINGHPTLEEPYYWIKVGEDNGSNFVTSYHFFVYPDSMRIMYYDVADDTALTLQEWRKKEK